MPRLRLRRRTKRLFWGLLVLGLAVGGWYGYLKLAITKPLMTWQAETLADLASQARQQDWLDDQVAALRAVTVNQENSITDTWMGGKLMLFANGEWLAYRYRVRPGSTVLDKDLLFAIGSDGQWYYSTFHFCKMLNVYLGHPEQPLSLGHFVTAFEMLRFDGRPHERFLKERQIFVVSSASDSNQAAEARRKAVPQPPKATPLPALNPDGTPAATPPPPAAATVATPAP